MQEKRETSRRAFLRGSSSAGLAALLGCSPNEGVEIGGTGEPTSGQGIGTPTGTPTTPGTTPPTAQCPDPFEGGEFIEEMPFTIVPLNPFGEVYNTGWDARRLFDLSLLSDGTFGVSPDDFYVRTEYPDLLTVDERDWVIRIDGLVGTPVDVHIDDVYARVIDQGEILLECSGNGNGGAFGLMSAANWAGAPLMQLIEDFATIDPQATRVKVTGFDQHSVPSAGGHSTPGASWIFSFEELERFGAFLATELGGVPLPLDNGFPVRLMVPTWYGCSNVKWVTSITLVDDNEPATSQMMEFADRTHQSGTPSLARDYRSANQELSATPVRVEKWRLATGEIGYRVVGIVWGGEALVSELRVRLGNRDRVVDCFEHVTNRSWNLWWHAWMPNNTGTYDISNYVDDPGSPQIRLDDGWYDRSVFIDEVS